MNPTIKDLYELNEKILEKIEKRYVSKVEFLPIKLLVYGATAMILTKVVGTGLGKLDLSIEVISHAIAQGF